MAQSQRRKAGKRLIRYALSEYYLFDDDEIENELDKAIRLFKIERKLPDWRTQVRSYMFSKPKIREKICDIAEEMFIMDGKVKEERL